MVTVAILAQGTHWGDALAQPFGHYLRRFGSRAEGCRRKLKAKPARKFAKKIVRMVTTNHAAKELDGNSEI